MKEISFWIISAMLLFANSIVKAQQSNKYVVIKGHVTDYHGKPLKNVSVAWQDRLFTKALFEAVTDSTGYYEAKVKKGCYSNMSALNMDEYIVTGFSLPEKDLRLEFWGWNFIADRDTTFDMQYNRLEVYGVNVFRIEGGTPAYTIYCRPMSLTRTLSYNRDNAGNVSFKKEPSGRVRFAPSPKQMKIKVTINGEEVKVLDEKEIDEFWTDSTSSNAYLLTVDLPKQKCNLPYSIFRIQMTDTENGDRGEAVYFLEKKRYVE